MTDPLNIANDILLSPSGLQLTDIDELMGRLAGNKIDYADIYFQHSRQEGWSLEDGKVKSGSRSTDQGVGLRAVSGEKTGFAVGLDETQLESIEESYEESEEVEANPYNIKKTGKTKKILGYKCEEYQTEDENSIVSIWSTDDLGKKINKTFNLHVLKKNFFISLRKF